MDLSPSFEDHSGLKEDLDCSRYEGGFSGSPLEERTLLAFPLSGREAFSGHVRGRHHLQALHRTRRDVERGVFFDARSNGLSLSCPFLSKQRERDGRTVARSLYDP